jgi:hypothetical protein
VAKVFWLYFSTDFTDGYQKLVASSFLLLVTLKLIESCERWAVDLRKQENETGLKAFSGFTARAKR